MHTSFITSETQHRITYSSCRNIDMLYGATYHPRPPNTAEAHFGAEGNVRMTDGNPPWAPNYILLLDIRIRRKASHRRMKAARTRDIFLTLIFYARTFSCTRVARLRRTQGAHADPNRKIVKMQEKLNKAVH